MNHLTGPVIRFVYLFKMYLLHVCVRAQAYMYHSAHVEFRLCGVISRLLPCGSRGQNSAC